MKINLDRNNIFDTANGTESEQSFYDVISELIPVANLQIIFCTWGLNASKLMTLLQY